MNEKQLKRELDRQNKELASMLRRHETEMLLRLKEHRYKLAELQLASAPALQDEVLGGMERWLEAIIEAEAGLADAEDARRLVRVVKRMQRTIAEEGKL